jgi:hypothetical protein
VNSDPQVAAELVDQPSGVPASSKRDVKADSVTPASLERGCLDPPMSAPGLAPRVAWLVTAKLCLPDFHQGSGIRLADFDKSVRYEERNQWLDQDNVYAFKMVCGST